ncbi:unnamed protein product [Agarophyton chilense]
MIRFLRKMGIQNIFRGIKFDVEEPEALLDHVLQVESGKTPGDDARDYPAKPLRKKPSCIPRRHVPDYYPNAIRFDPLCLEPDVEAAPLVPANMSDGEFFGEDPFVLPVEGSHPPVESAVVLPTGSPPSAPPGAAPQDELSYELPVAKVTIPPGEVTVETESPVGKELAQTSTRGGEIAPSSPLVHFPASVTAAAADLPHVCRTVAITASMEISTVLRESFSWARRSARYAAVVKQGQDLKISMLNILQQNAQAMFKRVTADWDARYGLNLSDREVPMVTIVPQENPRRRSVLGSLGPVQVVQLAPRVTPDLV